jgi:hypothetical protein
MCPSQVERIIDLEAMAVVCQPVSFCRFVSSEEQVQVERSWESGVLGSLSLYPSLSTSEKINQSNYRKNSWTSPLPAPATSRSESPLHSHENTSSNWTLRSASGSEGMVQSPDQEPSAHSQSWAEVDTANSPASEGVEVGIWDAVSSRPAVVDELPMDRPPSY